jgi:L-alanine-DL-glutamate epimerase-like enolase superfamily enzyme
MQPDEPSEATITDIEVIPVSVPLRPESEPMGLAPYVGSGEELTETIRLLVKLTTAGGVTGWGEMWPEASYSPAATRAVLKEDIIPQVVGMEVWDTEGLTGLFEREYIDCRAFVGGVDIAMWDAYGKILDVPLNELLGGRHSKRLPFAYLVGILDIDRSREHTRRAIDAGFDVLKAKGSNDWRQDVERLVAIDDEADGQLDLRLDPNQAWSQGETVRAVSALEDAGVRLQYIEQPTRVDAPDTLASLRQRTQTPIAVNEDTYRPRSLSQLCQHGAVDAAVVDLVPSGGIAATKRLAAVASEHDVTLAHHNGFDLGIKTAAILHLVTSTPGFSVASDTVYYGLDGHVIDKPFQFTDGTLAVPEGAGLGVTVDETALSKYTVTL